MRGYRKILDIQINVHAQSKKKKKVNEKLIISIIINFYIEKFLPSFVQQGGPCVANATLNAILLLLIDIAAYVVERE